jgi:amino acid permease
MTSRRDSKDHTTTVVQTLDEEDSVSKTDSAGDDSEQRALMFKARHIQMMALGSNTRWVSTNCRLGISK